MKSVTYTNENNGLTCTITVYNQQQIIADLQARFGDSITYRKNGKIVLLQVVLINNQLRLSPN